jgi:hypothetical protein
MARKKPKLTLVTPTPVAAQKKQLTLISGSLPAAAQVKKITTIQSPLCITTYVRPKQRHSQEELSKYPYALQQWAGLDIGDVERMKSLLQLGTLFYTKKSLFIASGFPIAYEHPIYGSSGTQIPPNTACMYVGKMGCKFRTLNNEIATIAYESFIINGQRLLVEGLKHLSKVKLENV